jgi:hypothetical protein
VNSHWAVALLLTASCAKAASSASAGSSATTDEGLSSGPLAPMDAREAAQWAAAAQGAPEERMRLVDLVGCAGLREGAKEPDLRATAISAMQYCRDFSELPWLAEVASDKSDVEARAALEAIDELAARPRRATDPEDADELHTGCGALLALARSASRPRERRVLAVRALRMLSERGCVRREEIPKDVDVK